MISRQIAKPVKPIPTTTAAATPIQINNDITFQIFHKQKIPQNIICIQYDHQEMIINMFSVHRCHLLSYVSKTLESFFGRLITASTPTKLVHYSQNKLYD